jgi:hypothetical protein
MLLNNIKIFKDKKTGFSINKELKKKHIEKHLKFSKCAKKNDEK